MGFSTENVQVNLKMNGVEAFKTLKDLNGHIAATRNAINKMDRTDPGYKEASGNLRNLLDQQKVWKEEVYGTKKAQTDFNKELNNSVKQQSSFMDMVKNGAAGLVAYFSIDAIIGFGKQVLDITANFQKLDAVLGNTFGSKFLASIKLADLSTFAALTPFSVNELTTAYVKLANQGFAPTRKEMRQLGDLASSTGKGFDQLAEAILDSMQGENERLKEFGVKAKIHGDMVTYTFKGVKTEVNNTAEAIRGYLTSLGDVEGVSGSMAVISETLTGKISNLGDSWDMMLVSIGSNTSGVFSGAISIMGSAINKITQFNKELETADKYKLKGDFWQQANRTLNPFASKGGTDKELEVAGIEIAKERVNDFVIKSIEGAKSAKDFSKAIIALNSDAKNFGFAPGISKGEKAGITDQYMNGIKALRDAGKNFISKGDGSSVVTDAQKKASEAAQKKKEAEDKKSIQEHIGLLADLQKVEEENLMNRMTANEREIAINDKKYAVLRVRAKGSKEELQRIDKEYSRSTLDIVETQADREIKKQKEITEKTQEELTKRLRAKADIEQQIFELGMTDEELAQSSVDKQFERMVLAAEAAGVDSTAIYQAWTDAKIKIDEDYAVKHKATEQEKQDFAMEMAQQASDTIFSIMGASRQAESQANIDVINKRREDELSNKNLSESQKKAINDKYDKQVSAEKKKAWQAEQRAAIAQAVINGALAVTKVLAQTGVAAPFVIPAIIAGTLAQVAVIAAQKAPQFAKGGQLPAGPSHANGGLSLIDPSGNKVGEIEGGEPILSRETYANNKMLVNQLLYNSQYRNGAPVSVNSALAIQGMQQYKTGGIAPNSSVSTVNNSSSPNDNSRLEGLMAQMIIAQQQANNKEVVFSTRLFDREQERLVQIRNDVNG